ncbi:hypothetical protein B6U84_05885 [Candidatus Bathyarchaeota archaeon ex4484_40]|nr:MAG: hypothetical protein B6U84_05885 [Candidatus Bathyarchaeota archaeon ex4484_40]
MRLEITSEDGDKIVLIFEGKLNREKLIQMADFLELYGGGEMEPRYEQYFEGSKLEKLARVISKYFPVSYFSSRDAVEAYISEYREPLTLSTASTYLARLAERGYLEKTGSGNMIRYRIARRRPRRPRPMTWNYPENIDV